MILITLFGAILVFIILFIFRQIRENQRLLKEEQEIFRNNSKKDIDWD
jgi:preprotein translocase subunit YajC